MNSDVSARSIAASVLAEAELPRIDIIAISASPTISALAVAAVRRGLRSEFSRREPADGAEGPEERPRTP